MPSKLQIIQDGLKSEMLENAKDDDRWMAFLRTAANNYKYSFNDQILIHAQRPDATACAEIGFWNDRMNRWVNKGAKGIALVTYNGTVPRLRYVFDVSDTHNRYGQEIRLWQAEERYQGDIMTALEDSFGELEDKSDFRHALISTAKNLVEDNMQDYLSELSERPDQGYLTDLNGEGLEVVFREALQRSTQYMLLSRCGLAQREDFFDEYFHPIFFFNTIDTISLYGTAVSDIAEMGLREIESTVRNLQIAERNANRTFANPEIPRYDESANQTRTERSNEHGTDIQTTGRLFDPESDLAGEEIPAAGQIRNASQNVPATEQKGPLEQNGNERYAVGSSERDRPDRERDDGETDEGDGAGTGRERSTEGVGSDALGAADEQHSAGRGGDRTQGNRLQLSGHDFNARSDIPYFSEDHEKAELLRNCDALKEHRLEIATFFAEHEDRRERGDFIKSWFDNTYVEHILESGQRVGYRAYDDVLNLWRGHYPSREKEVFMYWRHVADDIYGQILMEQWLTPNERQMLSAESQINLFGESSIVPEQPFSIPQAAIDYVLCGGSGFSEGKMRINTQFLKQEGTEKNAAFLKNEYGTGGHSDAVPGTDLWAEHDGKGLTIQTLHKDSPNSVHVLIPWNKVAKRIDELIRTDRYLNRAEKEKYPDYVRALAARDQRSAITEAFISVVRDYNDYQEQLNNTDAKLNAFILNGFARLFASGEKTAKGYGDNPDVFVLPALKEAMQRIIAENTHLTDRAQSVLDDLNGDIARPFEPTYDELNPPPEPEKQLVLSLGDTVYIGSQEYELLSYGEETVELFDPTFPLMHKEMPRAEFDEKVRENPLNSKYLQVVTEPAIAYDSDHIYLDKENETLTWIYFADNPSTEGHFVECSVSFDQFLDFYKQFGDRPEEFLNALNDAADTIIAEKTVPSLYSEVEAEYASSPDYEDFTDDNIRQINEAIISYQADRDATREIDRHEAEYGADGTKVFHDVGAESKPKTFYDEYSDIKAEYPDRLVLYQVGDFFEAFGEDARQMATELDLVLTSRLMTDGERVPMCGIPAHILGTYTDMLLDRGIDVVVSTPEDGVRKTVPIVSTNKEDPTHSQPVGAIEYLHTDGQVRERIEYTSEYQFKKDVQEENHYGVPMVLVFYEDQEGHTIDKSFLESLDSPLQGVRTERSPTLIVEGEQRVFDALLNFYNVNFPETSHTIEPDLDKSRISLVYSTTGDGEHEIQVYLNLEKLRFEYTVDQTEIHSVDCTDYDEIISILGNETFDSMIVEAEEAFEKQQETDLAPPQPVRKLKETPHVLLPEISTQYRSNFRIDNDDIGVGTPLERFHHNIMAIQLLKKLEDEHRLADTNEQRILADYVGWGGLSEFFREDNPHYLELKVVLTEDEYEAARESSLTAFYTPPVVIRAMYQALENMNFRNGNILEPSCGIGNFMGLLPDSMSASQFYGVELDTISGRIAQQLYQKNSIAIQGFEVTNVPGSFFDAAIGNVPFGQIKVNDPRYNKHNFFIHDYFFARTLDKVRPGGVIAFITSSGTLDKENPKVRKYIAQRAELLGAIRLPNTTFKAAAGTEVTADILFLQKRDRLIDIEPDWVHLGQDSNGITMNQYFIDNPDMILGEMKVVSGPYGPTPTCEPYEDQPLNDLLTAAIQNIHGQVTEVEFAELDSDEDDRSIPADPEVRNFSYTIVDGEIYYRENSRMNPVEVSDTAKNRIKGLISIRESVRRLIDLQTEDYPDADIQAEQTKLNTLYDDFSKKYGLINSRGNTTAFSSDSSYCLLASLEVLDDDGNFVRKADMFTKRTIKQKVIVQSVDTAAEALALSLAEKTKVDMEYMTQLTGKPEEELYTELRGVIFLNPEHMSERDHHPKYLPADEYLSGNVRDKLALAKRTAELYPDDYAPNVEALTAVQPKDLSASEISVRIGATWIPPEIIEDFMFQLLETPRYMTWNIHVHFCKHTGEWQVEGKSYDKRSPRAYNTYGTDRINAYRIIEETLNLKDVRIFDYPEDANGKKHAVLNKKETAIAQGKQELIKEAFQEWIWKDPERRDRLCRMYNDRFNSIRPRTYDGSHLNFVGMNPEITLRKHQLDGVAHAIYGGNELLAHEVGAGKTFTMVAIAQESKRLGLCQKSLFVVPNHLISQWASEYLQLYPAANILVATKKDFETKNRKKFCARIATGDYDAIIIGHSQFEKIPMSIERQQYILQQQLDEIMAGIIEMKANRGDRFSVKQLEQMKKGVELKLQKLNDARRKDDVVTFEELGVDRLFIDEAHYYKNLAAFTKMRNVGGIAQTEAMKSSDLYMKCRYLDELTGGKGVVFATGTPISNSMVEMYTMQKYLQYGTLRQNELLHFDSWASTFGQTVTAIELSPEGSGYRAKTRFAKFFNLPELMTMFREVADIQTADMLRLPVPKAKFHNVVLKPSEQQKEMVAALGQRAERVRSKMVSSDEDNMLLITNDGRKLALDQRLMNDMLPDSETGKVAACAKNVFEIWKKTTPDASTQMVFCDLSTPHGDGKFNVYDDLKKKLIAMGIPEDQIAYIHDANSEVQKKELFGKVRNGTVRVLLGSTFKMGAGTNVQKRLIALHHLDTPWRPADLAQRNGRIIRQGNDNPEVEIFTYVTENTFDSYLYQLVENKQKFIGQIMTSKSPVRSAEDVDEQALSYAEIKMLATGNPYIKEKMDLDIEVSKLKLLKANHLSQKYALEDKILKEFPLRISSLEQRIVAVKADIAHAEQHTHPNEDGFSSMEIRGVMFTDKKAAGTEILAVCKSMTTPDPIPLGTYRGFAMSLLFDSMSRQYVITLKNECTHNVPLGTDIFGNIQRLDNAIVGLPDKLKAAEEQLTETKKQLETAKKDVEIPFPHEEDLAKKSARLAELDAMLSLDKPDNEIVDDDRDGDAAPERSDRTRETPQSR